MKKLNYITIVATVLATIFAIKQCNEKRTYFGNLNKAKQETCHWYDKYKREHAQVEQTQGSYEVARLLYAHQLDSMAALLKVKPKQIVRIDYIDHEVHDTVEFETRVDNQWLWNDLGCDTMVQHFNYADSFALITGTVYKNKTKLVYDIQDSLYATTYTKSSGFLGLNKTTYYDVYSNNPKARAKGNKSLQIAEKPKNFGFGVQGGVGFAGSLTPKPYVGAGIQYTLFRF